MRRRRRKLFLKGRSARSRRQLAIVFALLFAPALPSSARADCVPFAEPVVFPGLDDGIQSIVPADLDGDGDLDVLSASSSNALIAWHENDGGAWTVSTISEGGFNVNDAAAGDVDRDGDLDVVAVSFYPGAVAWFENDGAGSGWTFHTISTLAGDAREVELADVDRDGDLDALSAAASDFIAWYRNGGDGSAWTLVTISVLADSPNDLATGDVDRDGDLDVLSASSYDNKIAWYENIGGGGLGWTPRSISTAANSAQGVDAADVDGDGDLDVFSASIGGVEIAWHENDGTPLGGGWVTHTISTLLGGATSVAGADVDDDGDLDLFVFSQPDATLAWLENDGVGAEWTFHAISTAADGNAGVTTADLDGDGDPDALTAFNGETNVAFFRNDRLHGAPLFASPVVLAGALDAPRQLEAGDLDGDGDLDLVSASQLDDMIAWKENVGGLFFPRTISTTAMGAISVDSGDLDSDGDLDVLSASRDDDTIAWYRNDGPDGEDEDLLWLRITISTLAAAARQVVAGDLDRDGDLDAISASRDDGTIAWYENIKPDLGNTWSRHEISAAASGAFSVAVADLDGDGELDGVSASIYDDEITWYKNDGSPAVGSWTALLISSDLLDPRFVVTGDFDSDGDTDIVSASSGDDSIVLHRNFFGTGTLWLRTNVSTTAEAVYSVRAVDVDGDGDLDLASANFGEATVAWYENDGAGAGWTEHAISTAPDQPTWVVLADLDRDGELDAAFTSNSGDSVRLALNLGTLVFAEGQETNESTTCWSEAVP